MGKVSDLSPKKIGEISGLLKANKLSQYEIGRIVGISRSSVRNIKKKMDFGDSLQSKRKGNCGRKRITTPRSDRKMRDACLENRKMSKRFLTKQINDGGIRVSQRTVQRRLAEFGLMARKPHRKPKLTRAMIKKRFEWAQKYKKFTVEDWKKMKLQVAYDPLKDALEQERSIVRGVQVDRKKYGSTSRNVWKSIVRCSGARQGKAPWPPQPSPPSSPSAPASVPQHGGGRYGVYPLYPSAPPAAHRSVPTVASITTTSATVPAHGFHKVSESLFSTAASNFTVGALSASTASPNSPYSPLQLEILGSYTNHQHNASTSSIVIEEQQQHTTTFQAAKKMEETKFIASRQQCFNTNALCCEIQTEDTRCWDGRTTDVITTTMQPVTIKTENIITTSKKASCNTCVVESPIKKLVPHFVSDGSLISNGGCSRTNPVTWSTTIPVSGALQVQVKREPHSGDNLLPIKMEQNSPSTKSHTVVDVVSHQPITTVAASINNGSIPVGIAVARQRLPHELSGGGSTLLSTALPPPQKDHRFPDMDVVGGGLVVEEPTSAWSLPHQQTGVPPGGASAPLPPPTATTMPAWQYPPQMSMEACVGGGSLQLVRDIGGGGLQLVREPPPSGLQLVRDPTSGALLLLPPAPTYLQAQPQPVPPTMQHHLQPQHMHDVWQEQFQQAVVWGGYGGVGTGVLLPHLPPPLAPLQLLSAELLTASSTTLHHHTTHQTHHSTRLVALTADPKPRPRPPPPPDQQGFVLYQVDCRERLNSPDLTPPLQQPLPPEVQDASNQTDTPTLSEEEEFNSNHAAECASEDIKHILIPRNLQPQEIFKDNIRITTGDNNIQITPMVYVDSAVQTKREPKTPGIECSITLSIPETSSIVSDHSKDICDKFIKSTQAITERNEPKKDECVIKQCDNNTNLQFESQTNLPPGSPMSNESVEKETTSSTESTPPLKIEESAQNLPQIQIAEASCEPSRSEVDVSGLELLSNSIEQFETRSKCIDTLSSSKPLVLHMPSLTDCETPITKVDKKSLPPPPLILIKTSPKSPKPTPDIESSHFSFSPRTPFSSNLSEQGNSLGGLNLLCALAEQRFMEEEEEEKRSEHGSCSTLNEDNSSQDSQNLKNIKIEKDDAGYYDHSLKSKVDKERFKVNVYQKHSKSERRIVCDLKKERTNTPLITDSHLSDRERFNILERKYKDSLASVKNLTERKSFERSRKDHNSQHIDKRRLSEKAKSTSMSNGANDNILDSIDKSLMKFGQCDCKDREPHECKERAKWLSSMNEMELNLIIRLANLQRQFKEKQRELYKLSPKKNTDEVERERCKRGPGRPRKKSTTSDRTSSPPSVNTESQNFRLLTGSYSNMMPNVDNSILKRTTSLTKLSEDENSQLVDIREGNTLRSISPIADSNSSQSSIATLSSSKKRKVGRPKKVSPGSHVATETIVAKKPKSKSSLVGYLLATKSKLNLPSNKGGIIYSKTNPPRPLDEESQHKKTTSKNFKGLKVKTNLKPSENNLYSSPASSVSDYKFTTGYDVKQKYASLLSNDSNAGSKMRPKLKAEPKLKEYSEEDDVNNDWCAPQTSSSLIRSQSSSMESLENIHLKNKQKVDQISLKHKSPKITCSKKKRDLKSTYDSSDSEVENTPKRRKSNKSNDIANGNSTSESKQVNDEHYDASDSDNNDGTKEVQKIKIEDSSLTEDILHKRVDRGMCTLDLDNLANENVRVLTAMGGLFYAGSFRAVQAPDVYAVTLDGERGHKPHILSREEALRDTILEVLPTSTTELLPGTRLCAYWSQQYRCLYPGTVAEPSTPDPHTDHKFVSVEFDDGDSGRIALEDIRLLQPDYPIVEYDQNPLLTLSKRRRQTSVNSTEDKKANTSLSSTTSHDLNTSATQTPKMSGLETFVSKSEQSHLEAEFNHRERKRLKKHKKDKIRRPHSKSGDENSEEFIRKKKKKHKCCDDHCKHRKHHKKHHRKHKKHHHSSSKEHSSSSGEDPTRSAMLASALDQSSFFETKDNPSNMESIAHGKTEITSQPEEQNEGTVKTKSKVRKRPFKVIKKIQSKSKTLIKDTKMSASNGSPDKGSLVKKIKLSPSSNKKKTKENDGSEEENGKMAVGNVDEDSDTPLNTSNESNDKKSKTKKRSSSTSEGGGSKMAAFLPAGAQLWDWRGSGYRRPQARGRARKCFYKSIQRGNEIINVGDSAVFLSTGRPDRPYIGQVESLWEGWQGGMAVRVRWYYHPEETVGCPAVLATPGGLFESPHTDENDVQTISHRCEVVSLAQYKRRLANQTQKRDTNDTYYLAGHYDPTHQTLKMEPDIPFVDDT